MGIPPKGLVDFHIYRDFVRTAFDEHIVEGGMYCNNGKIARLHFTVSEEYMNLFKERLKKVTKVFEKMFNIKYEVTFFDSETFHRYGQPHRQGRVAERQRREAGIPSRRTRCPDL